MIGNGVTERGTYLWFLWCEGQFCFKGLRVKPTENWFNEGGGVYDFGEVRMATGHGKLVLEAWESDREKILGIFAEWIVVWEIGADMVKIRDA